MSHKYRNSPLEVRLNPREGLNNFALLETEKLLWIYARQKNSSRHYEQDIQLIRNSKFYGVSIHEPLAQPGRFEY